MLSSINKDKSFCYLFFSTPSLKALVCIASLCFCPTLFADEKSSAPTIETSETATGLTSDNLSQNNDQDKPKRTNFDSPQPTTLDTVNDDSNNESVTKGRRKATECKLRPESEEWVDRMRSRTHSGLCFTADWIDGLFGDEQKFDGESFRGKVSLGFRHDEIEGFDPRLRVRIKTKLPNMSKRFNAFIGRVEEDSYISNTEVDQDRLNSVGLRSTNDEDSEWLVGIGYRDPEYQDDGFDISVGAKLSSGLSPYAKVAHRYLFKPSPNNYWRTTQTVFWRKEDGRGVSSSLDYTKILAENDILEWDTSIKYTEEREKWEWISSTTWHHEFTPKEGISTRTYVRGIRDNPVSIPEFGVTFTYVRPFLRDWLFIETGVDLRWEKEFREQEEYKSAVRFGIQFEMLLGDYYKFKLRERN